MLRKLTCSLVAVFALTSLFGCSGLRFRRKASVANAKAGPLQPGDQGYIDPGPYEGPLAQKYAGQFVFSSKPIAIKDSDDSSAFTSYSLGAPLYIRYFDKEAPHNLLPGCKAPRRIIRVDVNGQHAGKAPAYMPSLGSFVSSDANTRGGSSVTNELATPINSPTTWSPERETAANEIIRQFNSGVVAGLKEGTNGLHFLMTLDCGSAGDTDPVAAEGTLQVEVTAASKKSYLAKFGTTIGPSPHPENAKLAPQILKVMKNKADWDNEDLLGARVVSEDWQPIRNEVTGALVARSVLAALVVHAKAEPNPDVCRLFEMSYAKDAAGGALYFNGTGDSTAFPCGNAPK